MQKGTHFEITKTNKYFRKFFSKIGKETVLECTAKNGAQLPIRLCLYTCFNDSTVLMEQSLSILEVSRSHSDTPHSEGLLWASGRVSRRNRYQETYSNH